MHPILWLDCHRCRLFALPLECFFFGMGATFGVALHAVVAWWRDQAARETELARRLRRAVAGV